MKAKQDSVEDRDDGASGDPELVRGRQQALAVLVTFGGSVLTLAYLGIAPMAAVAVQLIVLGLLGAQLFRGTNWARWALSAMIGLMAVGNAYAGVVSFGGDGGWIVNVGLAVIYAWCSFVLSMSPAVTKFMASRREPPSAGSTK